MTIDKDMPWCDACGGYHHDTADHIRLVADLRVTEEDFHRMERVRHSATMILIATVALIMGAIAIFALWKADKQLKAAHTQDAPQVINLDKLIQCKRTYGCDTDEILMLKPTGDGK